MKTLSRPMFNMGGPIKQGIMNGIREPKKDGGPLVGSSAYPKTDGREHHFAVSGTIAAGLSLNAARIAAQRAAMRYGPRAINWARKTALPRMKSWFGSTTPASVTRGSHRVGTATGSYSPVTMNPAKFNPNWLGRDPLVQTAGWGVRALTSPTAGGLASKALRFVASPSSVIGGVAWYLWPDGTEKTTPPPTDTGGVPGGGDPGMTYTKPGGGDTGLSDSAKKAFANKQREERVQKYLDMMGYDRAKKTAIADALIDASKIVGDRGSLDLKNITQELINPVIQATSKRLDKPDQIREAVGLMATKAEIEKDLSKEKDALKTTLTELQIEGAREGLKASRSFEGGLKAFLATRKGGIKKDELEQISRLLADEHGESFIKTDENTVVSGDGIYMIGDGIYRVTGGVEKQIA